MPYTVGQRTVYRVGEARDLFPVKTLGDGEVQDFKTLRDACKASGTPFVDPEFPTTFDSIDQVDAVTDNKKDPPENPNWDGTFSWTRPSTLNPNLVFARPNVQGTYYALDDIDQGGLGDCYYLAAIGDIVPDQGLINFVIPADNRDEDSLKWGIYHFRFWVAGSFFDIVIDDQLVYADFEGDGNPTIAFMTLARDEMWPALLEKAYAKLYGNFGRISGGYESTALQDFTGGIAHQVPLDRGETLEWENLQVQSVGVFGGFGTPSGPDDDSSNNATTADNDSNEYGLITDHAYGLVAKTTVTDNSGNKIRLVRLRNPWGEGEWNGDWSDKSPIWSTIDPAEKARLDIVKNEGEFWITFEDATNPTLFDTAYTCYWINDLGDEVDLAKQIWKIQTDNQTFPGFGQWTSDWESMEKRPQYLVTLTKEDIDKGSIKSMLIVTLTYKNYIKVGPSKSPSTIVNIYSTPKGSESRVDCFQTNAFAYGKVTQLTTVPFTNFMSRETSLKAYLEPGTYLIVLMLYDGSGGDYLLRAISDNNLTMKLLNPVAAPAQGSGSPSGSASPSGSGAESD